MLAAQNGRNMRIRPLPPENRHQDKPTDSFIRSFDFAPAGTLAFWQGWLFLVIFIACSIAIGLFYEA